MKLARTSASGDDNKYVTGNKGRGIAVALGMLMPAEKNEAAHQGGP